MLITHAKSGSSCSSADRSGTKQRCVEQMSGWMSCSSVEILKHWGGLAKNGIMWILYQQRTISEHLVRGEPGVPEAGEAMGLTYG